MSPFSPDCPLGGAFGGLNIFGGVLAQVVANDGGRVNVTASNVQIPFVFLKKNVLVNCFI